MAPSARSRRSPTLATTLAAAALAGELAVATLVVATPDAHAQVDDPAPTGAAPTATSGGASAGAPVTPSVDPAPEPPPSVDVPSTPPPELPSTPPPDLPPAEVPAVAPRVRVPVLETPAAVDGPVRSGYSSDAAPEPSDGDTPVGGAPRLPDATEPARRAPDGRTPEPPRPRASNRDATPRQGAPRGGASHVAAGAPPAPSGSTPALHTIVAGEHLWGVAAARLAELTGRVVASLPAEEVAPYWARLCMLNATRLQSGDLDLVYPGEVIELPPL